VTVLCVGFQVWHELSQGQIYKVEPFQPHKHASMRDGVTMHDEEHVCALAEEMSSVQDMLCKTRGWMYRKMELLLESIHEAEPLQISDLLEGHPFAKLEWPGVCSLIKVSNLLLLLVFFLLE
jgi:hypothetical protein